MSFEDYYGALRFIAISLTTAAILFFASIFIDLHWVQYADLTKDDYDLWMASIAFLSCVPAVLDCRRNYPQVYND
jgi:hypothetical protein